MAENTAYSKNEPSIHIGRSNLTILVEKLIKQGVITIHVSKENFELVVIQFNCYHLFHSFKATIITNNTKPDIKIAKGTHMGAKHVI